MVDVTPLYIFLWGMSNVSYNLACWLHSHCMMWIPLSVASDTLHHSQSVNKVIHISAQKSHQRERERERERWGERAFTHECVYMVNQEIQGHC